MSEKLVFPNTKPTKIPKLNNANQKQIQKLFEILSSQIDDAFYCFYIGGRLYDKLKPISEKINLNNKWYVFALNSLDSNMNLIVDKLYDEADNSCSIINILKHYSIKENFENICSTTEDEGKIKSLIEEYNNEYSVLRKNLIMRRSGFHAHIGNIIFEEDFEQKISLYNQDCADLLYFARKTISALYEIVFNKNLPRDDFNDLKNQQEEIDKFVLSLNLNGN